MCGPTPCSVAATPAYNHVGAYFQSLTKIFSNESQWPSNFDQSNAV